LQKILKRKLASDDGFMSGGVGDTVKIVAEMLKKENEKPPVREYIKRAQQELKKKQVESDIGLREKMIAFLFWMYGFLLVSTVVIIFLQGFKVKGFSLNLGFLHWLGGATIGEIGILAGITYRALFKRDE
jgi:hypothetical protein